MRRSSDLLATTTFFPFAALRWGRPEHVKDLLAIAAGVVFAVFLFAMAYAPFRSGAALRLRQTRRRTIAATELT